MDKKLKKITGDNKKTMQKRWKKVKKVFGSHCMSLGQTYTYHMFHMPRYLLFMYARYKFCAKMVGENPKVKILELGCGEGMGTMLLAEHGHKVTAVDFDKDAIEWARSNFKEKKNITFMYDDFLGKIYEDYDVVISLDVIEHISKKQEKKLFKTIIDNLHNDGYCIIGTPNITALKYQSEPSRVGHVNLFSAQRLKNTMRKYFKNVFLFGMNDEVIHTGFYPMCQYIIVLGCGKK